LLAPGGRGKLTTVSALSIALLVGAMELGEPPGVTDEPPSDVPTEVEVAGSPENGSETSDTGASEPTPTEPGTSAPQVQRPTPAPAATTSTPAVSDATWRALKGKQVVVQTRAGAREGELAATDGAELVLIAEDGRPFTVPKADATDVRVAAAPVKESGAALPTTPPPASPATEPAEDAPTDPKEARAQKRKERREKREHALLGAFTAHGAAYAHWRGAGVNAGHAAYAMDWGIGVNPGKNFGMYAMGGGLLGARIDDKTIRANYGHLAFMFAFGGKYYFSMLGAGVAFNRLKMETETQKDVGLSIPGKIFGKIPLPKKLYIGIGLSYELGLVRGFNRFVNGIGGQIVFGRW
jgi:hypothetical protein